MAFRKIEDVSWNGNSGPEAFGGHIYSLTVQMGYTDGPTRITLNIVNDTGVYTATDKNGNTSSFKDLLSTQDVYTLKIGDLNPFHLYIVGYDIRTTVGQRILTLQLADTSILLDKIFVGLINRHVEAAQESPYGSHYGVAVEAAIADLKVRCLKCDGSSDTEIVTPGITKITGSSDPDRKYSKITRDIDIVQSSTQPTKKGNAYIEPNDAEHFIKNGGIVILGTEGFVEQECDIPEVDYSFTDLINALSPHYIKITDLKDRNIEYRATYTGTLREVLNSWCSDFGYSFTWNLEAGGEKTNGKPELIGIDLSKDRLTDPDTGQSYLENVKAVIEKIKEQNHEEAAVIESISENASLENTYKTGYVSQYLKPARTKETSKIFFKKKMFYNIPIEAITSRQERFNLQDHEFIISCTLAKFSPEMRRHYLYSLGISNKNVRKALGITYILPLSSLERDHVIANMEQSQMVDIVRKFENIAGGYSMALVHFDDDLASQAEQWQAKIASNFMGRYYYAPVEQEELESRNCDKISESVDEVEIVAGGAVKRYALDDHMDFGKLPYAEIMINPHSHTLQNAIKFIDLTKEGEHGYNPDVFLSGASGNPEGTYVWQKIRGRSKQIYIFEKEAPWSSSSGITSIEEEVEALKAVLPISDYNVSIMPITGTVKLMFRNLISAFDSDNLSSATKNKLATDDNLKLMIIPNSQGMKRGFEVRAGLSNAAKLGGAISRLYAPHYFNGAFLGNMLEKVYATQGDEEDTANNPECTTRCETSIAERVCGHCNYDSDLNKMYVGYPSWTGWKKDTDGKAEPIGVVAEYFRLYSIHVNISLDLILPVMQPYQGYIKKSIYRKKTIESVKKIMGSALPKKVDAYAFTPPPIDGITNTHLKYIWETPNFYKNSSMGIKVLENLITNDADAVIDMLDPEAGHPEGIIQVILPVAGDAEGLKAWNDSTPDGKLKSMTLEQYHDKLYKQFQNDSLGSSEVNETYSFTLVGLAFTEVTGLTKLLKPEKGLISLGVSVDEGGTVSDLTFGTRPPVNPNPQVFMKRIEPKLNVFGRS